MMRQWIEKRQAELEVEQRQEAKCVVQERPISDQQELESKFPYLQQDQTLAEMNHRYRDSQSVLEEIK